MGISSRNGAVALGFATALSPTNLFYLCFVGVFLGTFIGVLPGIGAARPPSRCFCL